jgi:hypothetical protein
MLGCSLDPWLEARRLLLNGGALWRLFGFIGHARISGTPRNRVIPALRGWRDREAPGHEGQHGPAATAAPNVSQKRQASRVAARSVSHLIQASSSDRIATEFGSLIAVLPTVPELPARRARTDPTSRACRSAQISGASFGLCIFPPKCLRIPVILNGQTV